MKIYEMEREHGNYVEANRLLTYPFGYFSRSCSTVRSQCSNTKCSFLFLLKTSNNETRFGCFNC
ncbi:hypothetical protein ANCCAN_04213 [Ancylostoma caninum]|uniref:Uncharacterized protein n=1 Tax=Ancylostoma caninum TaxID=29170 RepID=A0A368GZI0_ANCCA|nr:hypothetical protein ANCCAN_04213 [Ancylostoma caninum]